MKKLIDEKGRLFGRINVIDMLALLAVLILAAAFVLRAQRLAASNVQQQPLFAPPEETVPVVYEVTMYNTSIGHAEDIRVGDTLYNKDTSGIDVGTIVDVQVNDCYIPSQLADGSYVMAPVRGRYNIVLTVESEARPSQGGRLYISWSSELAAGLTYNYCTKYCLITGAITSVNWDEEVLEVWNEYYTAKAAADGV